MALIDQQEAAKQIRGNKEWLADCQWLKGFNDACEQSAQIVEQMKGQEIIHCKDCKFYGRADKRRFYRGSDCLNKRIDTIVPDRDFCSRAEKRGETDGQK